jgi:putative DNA primase/helicase
MPPHGGANGTGYHNATAAAAAVLRGRGFSLCRPDPGQKKPTYEGWSTRSLEPDDFPEGSLIGILGGALSDGSRPGHSLVIVDLDDPEAVGRGDEFLPPTGMIDEREGKPRDHRYYLVPNDTIPAWAVSKADQAAPASVEQKGHAGPFVKHLRHAETKKVVVDFLGTGAQVVCPSPGGRRRWVGGVPGEPAVVPFPDLWGAVCQLAEACGAKLPRVGAADGKAGRQRGDHRNGDGVDAGPKPSEGAGIAGVPKQLLRRVLAYLDKIDPAVSGQGGHDAAYWPARVAVYGFGLGRDAGFAVLLKHYNHRCNPPWSEAELRHKCEDADELPFDKPRGWLLEEEGPHWTDLGNARRVVERHGADLRYCHPWKSWLVWDGRRWAEDQTAEVVRRVKETQKALYADTAKKILALGDVGDDEERRKELAALRAILGHALKWEDARNMARCLELAKSEPGVPVLPAGLDRDPWLFNVLNGTIDLRTGRLRDHRREDHLTKLAPVAYDPDACCPLWLKFLDRVMGGSRDLIAYLQRLAGYGLTGDVSEQCLFFFHGSGANGKSTFLTTVLALLGDYGMQAVGDLLMAKHHESHPTERADLFGKRFVATIETEEGKRMAEALMKQLTGGDKVRARKMRQDFFEFDATFKIALAANHKPQVRGADHAVWRRIKLVPFTVTIPDDEKDKALPEKLKAELPGILAWCVAGCLDWQRHGMAEPAEVRLATSEYRGEQDSVQGFLNECCVLCPEAKVRAGVLFDAYGKWSGDKVTTQQEFKKLVQAKGYDSKQGTGGYYFWRGIGLPAEGES